jgi:hypothetical protein
MDEHWKVALCILFIVAIVILVARYPVLLVGIATARCRDGSMSFSRSPCGTCSWHGGVAEWYCTVPA